jgi:hypothetical protein
VLPDLPAATYKLRVRGYGLVDSQQILAKPGALVNLAASIAPNAHQAAQFYPAIYWYSMLKIPDKSLFSGATRDPDMPDSMTSQLQWLNLVKTNGCITCHQIGNLATRTIPGALGHFESSADAWERRIQSGQASAQMAASIGNFDTKIALTNYGNWTDRIAEGELPAATPPRPVGITMPRISMAGLMIQEPAGRVAGFGQRMATERPNISKAGPARGPRFTIFSSGPTPWRVNPVGR